MTHGICTSADFLYHLDKGFIITIMWNRRLKWSLIAVGSLAGVLFGLFMTLIDQRHDWRYGLLEGVFFGTSFGVSMTILMDWLMRQQRSAMGEASSEQVGCAARMLRSKSVPTDPEVRETVHRLATYRLEQARRWRIPMSVICGLLLLLEIFAASRSVGWSSWFFWASAVLFGFMLALTQWQLVSLRRRVEMLRPGSGGNPDAG
ncbi:MAG: hypothetical protein ACREP9_12515 [Candidatus Dormibacteraceae bacterium]